MAKATPFRREVTLVGRCACVFGLLRRVPYCHHQRGGGGGGGWLRLGGRAADEELLPPGGGAARRALLRATESSRLTPCWSLSACFWRSSFFRSWGRQTAIHRARPTGPLYILSDHIHSTGDRLPVPGGSHGSSRV